MTTLHILSQMDRARQAVKDLKDLKICWFSGSSMGALLRAEDELSPPLDQAACSPGPQLFYDVPQM